MRKPDKTFADYLGIAVCPVLIMLFIGSFVFFLLEIGYEGAFTGRLRWTLFWFVLASVLVSRISIENGSSYASLYGFGLAAATGLMTSRFVDSLLWVWALLAFIWWCTSKLTWDCTLIDDDEDASGEGLLQVADMDSDSKERNVTATEPRKRSLIQWLEKLFLNRSERDGQPHSPGLWVVYVSMLVLPVFGIGQLLIPADTKGSQSLGFSLLCIYVASALGLLLATSFLGLRRYLRQRFLQMPPSIARGWIGKGAILIAVVLGIGLLLPRPNAEYSLTALVGKIGSADVETSEGSWFEDDTEERNDSSEGIGDEQTENRPGRQADGDESKGSESQSKGSEASSAEESSMSPSVGDWLKWILYIVLAIIVMYLLIQNWHALMAAFRQLFKDFAGFLRSLFGLRTNTSKSQLNDRDLIVPVPTKLPRFTSFKNPFTSGMAERMAPAEVVQYTFEAMQAWARDSGVAHRAEQTPLEFAETLGRNFPPLSETSRQVTRLYGVVAYGEREPSRERLETLEHFWQQLTTVERGPSESKTN